MHQTAPNEESNSKKDFVKEPASANATEIMLDINEKHEPMDKNRILAICSEFQKYFHDEGKIIDKMKESELQYFYANRLKTIAHDLAELRSSANDSDPARSYLIIKRLNDMKDALTASLCEYEARRCEKK